MRLGLGLGLTVSRLPLVAIAPAIVLAANPVASPTSAADLPGNAPSPVYETTSTAHFIEFVVHGGDYRVSFAGDSGGAFFSYYMNGSGWAAQATNGNNIANNSLAPADGAKVRVQVDAGNNASLYYNGTIVPGSTFSVGDVGSRPTATRVKIEFPYAPGGAQQISYGPLAVPISGRASTILADPTTLLITQTLDYTSATAPGPIQYQVQLGDAVLVPWEDATIVASPSAGVAQVKTVTPPPSSVRGGTPSTFWRFKNNTAAVTSGQPTFIPTPVNIGVGLNGLSYYSGNYPFIDLVKTSKWFLPYYGDLGTKDSDGHSGYDYNNDTTTPNSSAYQYGNKSNPLINRTSTMDPATGNWTTMPTGANKITFVSQVRQDLYATNKRHRLTWSGTNKRSMISVSDITAIAEESANSITFEANNAGIGAVLVTIAAAEGAALPTNFQLTRADQTALLAQGEIFTPEWLAVLAPYNMLRFMDWLHINGNFTTSWAQRTPVGWRTYTDIGANTGVPYEVIAALVVKHGAAKGLWLNIPTFADDNFVMQLGQYFASALPPSTPIEVELGNEPWNSYPGFTAIFAALQAKADALWGGTTQSDGYNGTFTDSSGTHISGGNMLYHAYRAAQVANILKPIFANFPNYAIGVSAQTTFYDLDLFVKAGVARANLGTLSSLFKNYYINAYFGDFMSNRSGDDLNKMLAWTNNSDGGVAAFLDEAEHGATLSSGSDQNSTSLDHLRDNILPRHRKNAADMGLIIKLYEANSHFVIGGSPTTPENNAKLGVMVLAALRAPRMGDLLARSVTEATAQGAARYMAFVEMGNIYPGNNWSLQESLTDNSYRKQGLLSKQPTA